MPSKSSYLSLSHETRGFHCKRVSDIKSKSYLSSKCFITSTPLPSLASLSQKKLIGYHKISCATTGSVISLSNSEIQGKISSGIKDFEIPISGASHCQIVANAGTFRNVLINLPISDRWNDKFQDSLSKPTKTHQISNNKDKSDTQFDEVYILTNFNHAHSESYNAFDQRKDALLIGGDLLISKTFESSCKSTEKDINIRAERNVFFFPTHTSTHDTLTIEKIEYKCEVLQEHSKVCGCQTPRLHVYLTSNHRCRDLCTINNYTNIFTNRDPKSSSGCTVNICSTADMRGKSRGRPHMRKPANTQKLPNQKVMHASKSLRVNAAIKDKNMCQDEPESELLIVGECESLPTIMNTLSGDVEYIVLDDDTLNLSSSAEGAVSPDALKSKINNIYEDIDEKPDIRCIESRLTNRKEIKCRRVSDSSNQLINIEHSERNLDTTASSSLAGVCTNRCPSIRDIFGDVSIKEEPIDDIKNDMTVDDFSKEIKKLSNDDLSIISDTGVKKKEIKEEGYDEGTSKGLFARLIKEEITGDEKNNDAHSSDDSLGPLQIDEDSHMPSIENTDTLVVKEVSEFNMPSVNIISPFKIRILLGSPNREAFQIQTSQPHSGISKPVSLLNKPNKVKKNGTALPRGFKRTLNMEPETDLPLVTATSTLHTIQSLTCIYCNTECPNGEALAQHFEDHQKDGLIICYFCQKSFGDKTGMKRHMRTHTGEKPYQCQVCGKRFSLPGNFKKHRDIHEDRRTEPCGVCGKTFRRKEHLKYHMRTHTGEKPYMCSECGTSFTARYSLQIHMNIHLGKKPYKCTYCNKAFSDKSTMRKHVRVHTGEKPFRCQECRRCFGESGTLAAHMATHRSDRPYKCDKCELRFKTTGGLRQHEKVHSGEKQFACRFCGMKFLQKYNMTMHERIHTGEKPYTCSHCQRSFRSRSCLAKHVVLHGGDDERRFRCDHCSSRFYRKAHLRRHIDMHLGIKNYECNTCSKKFCTRGTLKSHLKTFHSHGARRFPCNWCGRVFKRQVYVSTHVCLKNPIKCESGEQETHDHPRSVSDINLDKNISSDSEGSSVEVKSEPEDELIEEDVGIDDGEEYYEDNDDDDDDDDEEVEIEDREITEQMILCQ
ncbi:uncharacterized protein [Procambarus clarkii]|uniref:uncharacterized protein n=1 Tax=Procambarus clarkii TaxID=6728 RepID=UPI0037449A50